MSEGKFQIGLIQMDSGDQWEGNRKAAARYISQAAEAGASLVIFPETVDYIGTDFRGSAAEVPGAGDGFFAGNRQ